MTARGWAILAGSLALIAIGLTLRWPESTGLGAAGLALIALAFGVVGWPARCTLVLDQTVSHITRGQPAAARLTVTSARRARGLSLAEGATGQPRISRWVPRTRGQHAILIPIDTSERGQFPVGPYVAVQGDAWGLIRRFVARAKGGVVTVQPRVHDVRNSLTAQLGVGTGERAGKRVGSDHFQSLREYVLGDEARLVHWRSSARAGRLLVKQQVAPPNSGTTIILDVDSAAYADESAFSGGAQPERFESAVEVAASFAVAEAVSTAQVHVLTTRAGAPLATASAGATSSLLDMLSVVQLVSPIDTAPEELPFILKRTASSRVIIVTGSPRGPLLSAVQTAARSAPSALLVRIRSTAPPPAAMKTLDIAQVEDLV